MIFLGTFRCPGGLAVGELAERGVRRAGRDRSALLPWSPMETRSKSGVTMGPGKAAKDLTAFPGILTTEAAGLPTCNRSVAHRPGQGDFGADREQCIANGGTVGILPTSP